MSTLTAEVPLRVREETPASILRNKANPLSIEAHFLRLDAQKLVLRAEQMEAERDALVRQAEAWEKAHSTHALLPAAVALVTALFCTAAVLGGCELIKPPTACNVGKGDDAPWVGMEIEPVNGPSKATPAGAVYGPSVLVGTTEVRK